MNQEIEKTDLQKRQQIIKTLAVSGVAVAAWHKPTINSVILPAHAQTTGGAAVAPDAPSSTTQAPSTQAQSIGGYNLQRTDIVRGLDFEIYGERTASLISFQSITYTIKDDGRPRYLTISTVRDAGGGRECNNSDIQSVRLPGGREEFDLTELGVDNPDYARLNLVARFVITDSAETVRLC